MSIESGSKSYAVVCCMFASLCGLFFGYDQGVTGGVLVMRSFLEDFCIDAYGGGDYNKTTSPCYRDANKLPAGWITFTTLFNVLYYLGCIGGAFAAGIIADTYGRKKTIFCSGVLFVGGTTWVIISPKDQHVLCVVGRIVEGMGIGIASFISPVYGAEMAPKELRGMLSGFMQMTIVTGLLLAGIMNYIVENDDNGWRVTNGVAIAPPVIVMIGIWFLPESPRWLYKTKGRELAESTLKSLRRTDNIQEELNAIGYALEEEGSSPSKWSDLMEPSIRHRLMIAMMLQLLQQATGINPMFTYGGQIFKSVVGEGIISLLILQSVNFVSTIPAMLLVDKLGRRFLLLVGAVGMVVGHVMSGILFTSGCGENEKGETICESGQGWAIIIFTAFFIFNFAISWGPICWIYPSEIFPNHVRAKAVSVSTMTNWCMGALMIGIPKLFPYLGINGVFFLFASLCASAGFFVYLKCPETKGLLLEEIESLFKVSIAIMKVDLEKGVYTEEISPKPTTPIPVLEEEIRITRKSNQFNES